MDDSYQVAACTSEVHEALHRNVLNIRPRHHVDDVGTAAAGTDRLQRCANAREVTASRGDDNAVGDRQVLFSEAIGRDLQCSDRTRGDIGCPDRAGGICACPTEPTSICAS